ncbi:MAG: non-heme iron oxygenase ferredoxin subunit [Anaerolineae bacterium]|nr:non-heme iron oxygenase ferredoxin subunit [Anaerolineae bacterium]MDK1118558.1 non-heme iron oxygenase ferredoxin subunit [Anaerolineae bacterium]
MFNYTEIKENKVDYLEIAPTSELPEGERLFVDIGDTPVVIFNIAGKFYAVGDICSHDDGPLGDGEVEEFRVVCPRHGAEFDVRSGKAVRMPAVVDIPAYPVRIKDGMIEVGVPKD